MILNMIKTGMLFFVMTALVLGAGYLIAGEQGLITALFVAGIMNVVGFFFSDKIALKAMRAREVGPDHPLHKMVANLTRRADLPMPRVYISPTQAPNAFATGRNPKNAAVCATQGLLQALDEEEVAGVMAHELAHVKHRDILIQSVAATLAGAISMLGYMFMFGARNRESPGHPLIALLFLILGPLAAGMIQMAISRQREYAADTRGGEICGNPMWLARALEKIHYGAQRVPLDINPAFNNMFIIEPLNPLRSAAKLFATHPPIEARLKNLIGRESTGMYRSARA
jgi:heat shock protein HtpX